MKKMGKMSMFVVLALVIAGIFLMVATVPKMLIEVWNYMGIDVGYKWVINMLVGFIVAIGVRIICRKANNNTVANVIAGAMMLIMIVTCECVIWHPKEFGALITSRVTIHKIAYMGLGIAAAFISYMIVEVSTRKEKGNNPSDSESAPKTEESGGTRRRRGTNTGGGGEDSPKQ